MRKYTPTLTDRIIRAASIASRHRRTHALRLVVLIAILALAPLPLIAACIIP